MALKQPIRIGQIRGQIDIIGQPGRADLFEAKPEAGGLGMVEGATVGAKGEGEAAGGRQRQRQGIGAGAVAVRGNGDGAGWRGGKQVDVVCGQLRKVCGQDDHAGSALCGGMGKGGGKRGIQAFAGVNQ